MEKYYIRINIDDNLLSILLKKYNENIKYSVYESYCDIKQIFR